MVSLLTNRIGIYNLEDVKSMYISGAYRVMWFSVSYFMKIFVGDGSAMQVEESGPLAKRDFSTLYILGNNQF